MTTIGLPTLERIIADTTEGNATRRTKELAAVDSIEPPRMAMPSSPKSHMAVLRQALEADVVWDEIVALERLDDPGEMVYDFTVPGNDSFMVDCGILVHNTLNSVHYDEELLLSVDGELKRVKIGGFTHNVLDEAAPDAVEDHPREPSRGSVGFAVNRLQALDQAGRAAGHRPALHSLRQLCGSLYRIGWF